MRRPVYYLWRQDYPSEAAYEQAKNLLGRSGFCTVTFTDEQASYSVQELLELLSSYPSRPKEAE